MLDPITVIGGFIAAAGAIISAITSTKDAATNAKQYHDEKKSPLEGEVTRRKP